MLNVYELSSDDKFIDMRYAAERDLAYFYSSVGKINEAIRFYEQLGKNVGENLLKMGRHLLSLGERTSAESILSKALKLNLTKEENIEALFILINLYEKYNKVSKHLKISKILTKEHQNDTLNPIQKKDLLYHVQRRSSLLLKQAASSTYKRLPKQRKAKAYAAAEYFTLLKVLFPKKSLSHEYFIGESFYAAGDCIKALPYYESVSKKKSKFKKMAINGMLACLGKDKNLSRESSKKHFSLAFNEFIRLNPKSPKSAKLLQRLFSNHLKSGVISKAEQDFLRYVSLFPNDYKIHEAMFAKVFDHYQNKKDIKGIKMVDLKNKLKGNQSF